jgi:hypothetical protein
MDRHVFEAWQESAPAPQTFAEHVRWPEMVVISYILTPNAVMEAVYQTVGLRGWRFGGIANKENACGGHS